jgi:hypothetical protein
VGKTCLPCVCQAESGKKRDDRRFKMQPKLEGGVKPRPEPLGLGTSLYVQDGNIFVMTADSNIEISQKWNSFMHEIC